MFHYIPYIFPFIIGGCAAASAYDATDSGVPLLAFIVTTALSAAGIWAALPLLPLGFPV